MQNRKSDKLRLSRGLCRSKLKPFRRVDTRCDQTAASFLAFVELFALRVRTKSVHAG